MSSIPCAADGCQCTRTSIAARTSASSIVYLVHHAPHVQVCQPIDDNGQPVVFDNSGKDSAESAENIRRTSTRASVLIPKKEAVELLSKLATFKGDADASLLVSALKAYMTQIHESNETEVAKLPVNGSFKGVCDKIWGPSSQCGILACLERLRECRRPPTPPLTVSDEPGIIPMEAARRHCVGTKGTSDDTWFLFQNETVCKFCKTHLKLDGAVPLLRAPKAIFSSFLQGATIRCNALSLRLEDTATISGPFRAMVHSTKHSTLFYTARGKQEEAKQGVGIYALPTQEDFEIILMLDPLEETSNTGLITRILGQAHRMPDADCFRIEAITVGERKVDLKSLNLEGTIIGRKVRIGGFAAGAGNSFRFVSVTEGEKKRKEVDAKVLAGYCEDNKIRCVLQRLRRREIPQTTFHEPSVFHGGYTSSALGGGYGRSSTATPLDFFGSTCFGAGGGGASSSSFGAGNVPYGRPPLINQGNTNASSSLFQKLSSPAGELDLLWGGDLPKKSSAQNLSGGTTINGNQTVSAVATRTTNDHFNAVGEPVEIVLQLACFQTAQEKEADNKRMRAHEDGYDYYRGLDGTAQLSLERLEQEIKKLVEHRDKLSAEQAFASGAWQAIHRATYPGVDSDDVPIIDPTEITESIKQQCKERERLKQAAMLMQLS